MGMGTSNSKYLPDEGSDAVARLGNGAALDASDLVTIERAALQLSGMLSPHSHVHAVMRGLGLTPVQAAPFVTAVLARVAEIEAGKFTEITIEAIGAAFDVAEAA